MVGLRSYLITKLKKRTKMLFLSKMLRWYILEHLSYDGCVKMYLAPKCSATIHQG